MKKKYYCGITEDWIKEALFEDFKRQSEVKQCRAIAKLYRLQAKILHGVQNSERSQGIARLGINVKNFRSQ